MLVLEKVNNRIRYKVEEVVSDNIQRSASPRRTHESCKWWLRERSESPQLEIRRGEHPAAKLEIKNSQFFYKKSSFLSTHRVGSLNPFYANEGWRSVNFEKGSYEGLAWLLVKYLSFRACAPHPPQIYPYALFRNRVRGPGGKYLVCRPTHNGCVPNSYFVVLCLEHVDYVHNSFNSQYCLFLCKWPYVRGWLGSHRPGYDVRSVDLRRFDSWLWHRLLSVLLYARAVIMSISCPHKLLTFGLNKVQYTGYPFY